MNFSFLTCCFLLILLVEVVQPLVRFLRFEVVLYVVLLVSIVSPEGSETRRGRRSCYATAASRTTEAGASTLHEAAVVVIPAHHGTATIRRYHGVGCGRSRGIETPCCCGLGGRRV